MSNHNLLHKALLFAVCLMTHVAVWGQSAGSTFTVDNLKYKVLNEQEVEVSGDENKTQLTGELQIPSTVTATTWNKTYTVTVIGSYAFDECRKLTTIDIPESITTIKDCAFSGCRGLISINIPNSVTTIGSGAFNLCISLTEINIPQSVTTIKSTIFELCSRLENITVDSNNINYSSKDGVLFDKSQQKLIECPGGKMGEYQIPASVIKIGNSAFCGCTQLTNIKIPNSVTTIEKWAFEYCNGLTNINIPNSVTTIIEDPFESCSNLKSITVDSNNTTYSSLNGVLFDKSQQKLIRHPEGKIGEYAIPSSVTTIGNRAFNYCSRLANINLPNSVTTIGNWAFGNCNGLTNIKIPDSVTKIGEHAFTDCRKLTNIDIPNSVKTIEGFTFSGCRKLTSINIPNSVTTIGYYAFESCDGLTNINIPQSVTWIRGNAFAYCYNLESLHLYPTLPPALDFNGIEYCPNLKTIYVPKEAVTIYKAYKHYNKYNIVGMDEPTGIDKVETTGAPQSGNIYDLNGRLVHEDGNLQALPKGIYIMNGKKMVR